MAELQYGRVLLTTQLSPPLIEPHGSPARCTACAFSPGALVFLPVCSSFPSQAAQERLGQSSFEASLSLLLVTQLSGSLSPTAPLTQAEWSEVCSHWQFSLSLADFMVPVRGPLHPWQDTQLPLRHEATQRPGHHYPLHLPPSFWSWAAVHS